jgi:hypothetical protein
MSAEKPDIKKVGLKLLEKFAVGIVDEAALPYAKYYSNKIGLPLDGFIDDMFGKLKSEFVDKIDGEDNV